MSSGNFTNHPLGPRKRFCVNGHDTFICGRDEDGHGHCRDCEKDRHKKIRKRDRIKIKEWFKNYYINNTKEILERNAIYREAHIDEIKAQRDKRYKEHPEIEALRNVLKNEKRGLRVPNFGQYGIQYFYSKCPKGMVVDHIIPLQGKLVSGLHVRYNLQYLTPKENNKKHNQFDGSLENNGWRLK